MITYVIGNLFQSPAKVLVNTVNTVGVMGKGIAKEFKTLFPEMFPEYQRLCEQGKLDIGKLHLYRSPHKWVLNFPTKKHWRHPSKPEYIEAGLKAFAAGYRRHSFATIAFPQLGCGHGDLNWEKQVRPLMEKHLGNLPIEVFIHLYRPDPFAPPEHQSIAATKQWLRAEPESLAFLEVWEDVCEVLEQRREFITLNTGKAFQARRTEQPAEGLMLTDGDEVFVPQDALLDAWQHLRSVGFLTAEGLTHGMDVHADKLLTVLSRLPYLKPAKVALKHEAAGADFQLALQFLPRQAPEQITLSHPPQLVAA